MLIIGMVMLQVNTHLTCSADQFKFLWGIKGHVERIMLQESKRVALSYVDFATKLATCAPGLEAVWDASRKVRRCRVFPLHECAMHALSYLLQRLLCTSGGNALLTRYHTHLLCPRISFTGCKALSQQCYISRSTAVAAVFQAYVAGTASLTAPWVLSQKAIVPGLDLKGVAAAADEASAPSSRSEGCSALFRGLAESVLGCPSTPSSAYC